MLQKKDLKPGMEVKNWFSKNIGIVRGDPNKPNKLLKAHRQYIQVVVTSSTRKHRSTVWYLEHCHLVH